MKYEELLNIFAHQLHTAPPCTQEKINERIERNRDKLSAGIFDSELFEAQNQYLLSHVGKKELYYLIEQPKSEQNLLRTSIIRIWEDELQDLSAELSDCTYDASSKPELPRFVLQTNDEPLVN